MCNVSFRGKATAKATVMVQNFEVRKTRKGDSFASLRVNLGERGKFAEMDAKIWQFDRFQTTGRPLPAQGSLIEAQYRADEYQGRPQWTIEEYRILEGEEREKELAAFVPSVRIDSEFYQTRLEELIDATDPERVSGRILREIFDRAEFREAFCLAPAAIRHHQNYPGGLLEHTINVTTLALSLADAYASPDRPGLTLNSEILAVDRGLLIAAGLVHDIGKMETYRLDPMSSATDLNAFEGHLAIGYAEVRAVAEPLRAEPPYPGAVDEIDKLMNCVLAHHGVLEYGSPVTPACVEAFLLSQADIADARLASIVTEGHNQLRQNPESRWLRHFHFPSGIFIGDWPRPEA